VVGHTAFRAARRAVGRFGLAAAVLASGWGLAVRMRAVPHRPPRPGGPGHRGPGWPPAGPPDRPGLREPGALLLRVDRL